MLFPSIAQVLLIPLALATALPEADPEPSAIADFEQQYIRSLGPDLKPRLIGFARIDMPFHARAEMHKMVRSYPEAWAEQEKRGWFWFAERSELRSYFPVRDAMVHHGRSIVEADEHGVLRRNKLERRGADDDGTIDEVDGDLQVLGRRQNDDVHGVEHNVIRDGVIYLHTPRSPAWKRGNTYVYDFGTRENHDHSHEHEARDGEGHEKRAYKVPCFKNHGGKICTFIKGVGYKGRCGAAPPRSRQSCVDYNGWWPKCSCGKKSCGTKETAPHLPGSDCGTAMVKGYCWNEVM